MEVSSQNSHFQDQLILKKACCDPLQRPMSLKRVENDNIVHVAEFNFLK